MALSGEQIVAGIVLRVDSRGAVTGSRRAKRAFRETGAAAQSAVQQVTALRSAFMGLAMGATSLGVITGAGAALFGGLARAAIGAAEEFQSNLKMLSFTTQLDETSAKFKELRKLALQTGRDTAFSPAEAAEGLRLMVAAGLSADQSMKTLAPTLDLVAASAGRITLTEGASLVAATMKKFSLNADEARKIVDQMAKSTTQSNIQFEDLTGIIDAMGATPALFGTKLNETLAMAGAMRNVGISARETGQTMKGMMRFIGRLSAFEAADFFGARSRGAKFLRPIMEGVGLEIDDLFETGPDGARKLMGTQKIITKIMTSMANVRDESIKLGAANRIFGDQGKAAIAAFEKMTLDKDGELLTGMAAFNELLSRITDSAGTAEKAAKKMLFETWAGAKKFLTGTLQTLASQILEPAILPVLSKILHSFATVVNKLGALVEASPLFRDLLGFGLVALPVFLAVLTVVLGLTAVVGMAASGILAIKAAILSLGAAMVAAKVTLGGLLAGAAVVFAKVLLVIGAIVLAIKVMKAAWKADFAGIRTAVTDFWAKVSTIFSAIREFLTDRTVGSALWDSMTPGMKKVFFLFTQMHDRVTALWSGLRSGLSEAVPSIMAAGDAIGAAFGALFEAFGALFNAFGFELEAGASKWETFGMVVGVVLSTAIEIIALMVQHFAMMTRWVIHGITWMIESLRAFRDAVTGAFSPITNAFRTAINVVRTFFDILLRKLTGPVLGALGTFRDTVGDALMVFGVGDEESYAAASAKRAGLKVSPRAPARQLPQHPSVSNPVTNNGNTSNSVEIGKVEVHAAEGQNAEEVAVAVMEQIANGIESEAERGQVGLPMIQGAR